MKKIDARLEEKIRLAVRKVLKEALKDDEYDDVDTGWNEPAVVADEDDEDTLRSRAARDIIKDMEGDEYFAGKRLGVEPEESEEAEEAEELANSGMGGDEGSPDMSWKDVGQELGLTHQGAANVGEKAWEKRFNRLNYTPDSDLNSYFDQYEDQSMNNMKDYNKQIDRFWKDTTDDMLVKDYANTLKNLGTTGMDTLDPEEVELLMKHPSALKGSEDYKAFVEELKSDDIGLRRTEAFKDWLRGTKDFQDFIDTLASRGKASGFSRDLENFPMPGQHKDKKVKK